MLKQSLLIVGNGMAGAKVAEEILARKPDRFAITMFGDEPRGNYNRVALSAVLGGYKDVSDIVLNPASWYEEHDIDLHAGWRVAQIDRNHRRIIARDAERGETCEVDYDQVILATGSRPFVPPLDGLGKAGIFVFRTLADCEQIARAAKRAKRAVVLGGGLLGLEAARGLLSFELDVTVVEVAPHLMPQQLDPTGAAILQGHLEQMGMHFLLGRRATAVLGADEVHGLRLDDGSELAIDLVVVSCGIRPNVEVARDAGLAVERAIVVDDQMRTSDPAIFSLGECAQHRGRLVGLVEPIYEQASVLADVITETRSDAAYQGSRPVTVLKVMGVDVASMGELGAANDTVVFAHADPEKGTYRRIALRGGTLVGAVVVGEAAPVLRLRRAFREGEKVDDPFELLRPGRADAEQVDVAALPDLAQICDCHSVSKGRIVECIRTGAKSVAAIGDRCKAGTGCGSCQPLLGQLIATCLGAAEEPNRIEVLKREKDGLDALPDILRHAQTGNFADISDDDAQRMKWHGLFLRKPTPGHFMMRIRSVAGQMNATQWRLLAALADEHGKGFCDLTTRQQVQLRWFTIVDTPRIWQRLAEVGLGSLQTGMDNVRGVCGCPAAGLTPNELVDATPIARRYTERVVGNREFSNLPRKFNVTITGCLENCCHPETQDIGLIPARRDAAVGFNVLVGGKQGSGGYRAASPLDVFVPPEEAADLCAELTLLYRDHGPRALRNRARFAFLVDDRGVRWVRRELERRWGRPLCTAGTDARGKQHADHVGIYRQKRDASGRQLNYVGLHVPVGRITSQQMRTVADLAERYGNGELRLTTGQNVVIPNVPDASIASLIAEAKDEKLKYDPSPIMRGLVACTGIDYCSLALIETKSWAVEVARDVERQLGPERDRIAPIRIHWSGCPAGCGLHQTATIGLLGRRIKFDGELVEAANVFVGGRPGPDPQPGRELLHDVPCAELASALVPIVRHYRRK